VRGGAHARAPSRALIDTCTFPSYSCGDGPQGVALRGDSGREPSGGRGFVWRGRIGDKRVLFFAAQNQIMRRVAPAQTKREMCAVSGYAGPVAPWQRGCAGTSTLMHPTEPGSTRAGCEPSAPDRWPYREPWRFAHGCSGPDRITPSGGRNQGASRAAERTQFSPRAAIFCSRDAGGSSRRPWRHRRAEGVEAPPCVALLSANL
jgi:hypothetical protein